MATKRTSKAKSTTRSGDDMTVILAAAMAEAAGVGWAQVSLAAIAARAKMKLGDVLRHVPTKAHLLARFADHVDRQALGGVGAIDHAQSVKDRLFDLLMKRFDALQAHRQGVKALMSGVMRDPGEGAMLLGRLARSMESTLAAAGLSPHGLKGLLQVMGLKAAYLAALRAWRQDDSADMAKTMAALDRALGLAERAGKAVFGRRPKPSAETKAA
jgi:AcrR family transcriptional regulator